MIPIEKAVHARLVREGLERARSSPDSEASEHDPVMEGRLTRAGRCACMLRFPPLLLLDSRHIPHIYSREQFTSYFLHVLHTVMHAV